MDDAPYPLYEWLDRYDATLREYNELAARRNANPLLEGESEWRSQIKSTLSAWPTLKKEIDSVTPPDDYAAIHADLKAVADAYNNMAVYVSTAISDSGRPKFMDKVRPYMDQADMKWISLYDKLEAFEALHRDYDIIIQSEP